MPTDRKRISVPLVEAVQVASFSLYEQAPNIELDLSKPVFCLVGANGLGKSTMLASIGFALTGIVADPNRKFSSLEEYYRESLPFNRDYYTGRITPIDRAEASVEVTFRLRNSIYQVKRAVFDPERLIALRIERGSLVVVDKDATDDADDRLGAELNETYKREFLADSGLATFEQYAFLHHFLLTFDERRHLLFWDPDVARQAIYLSFGIDPLLADQADSWQRRADRHDSQARQAQYAATQAMQVIHELSGSATADPLEPVLVEHHEELVKALDSAEGARQQIDRAVEDQQLAFSVAASENYKLLRDYERVFNEEVLAPSSIANHPYISRVISEHKCSICGTEGPHVADRALAHMADNVCPLCDSPLGAGVEREDDLQFSRLEDLDKSIQDSKSRLDALESLLSQSRQEARRRQEEVETARALLSEFERTNRQFVASRVSQDSAVAGRIRQLQAEHDEAKKRRDRHRELRDQLREKLTSVNSDIIDKYRVAEAQFVPRFQALAHSFLGIDLQIALEQRARGAELVLVINGTRRRRTTQLSESQRYFVDIALRMALVEYLVGDEMSTLLIDTPEGSLDISYEDRAGRLFNDFAASGNRLFMTANLNSSRLVQRLAALSGAERMHVERMTSWGTLSDVQSESLQLFDDSFARIHEALNTGRVQL